MLNNNTLKHNSIKLLLIAILVSLIVLIVNLASVVNKQAKYINECTKLIILSNNYIESVTLESVIEENLALKE